MFSKLFSARGRIPDSEVVYAIGDIHGRADLLSRLHRTIEQEVAASEQQRRFTIVYLGDYIDRGPHSSDVIDLLLDEPVKGAESVLLKGNHEDALLRFLAGDAGADAWLSIGGGATAMSYGVSLRGSDNSALSSETVRDRLLAAIPSRHLSLLEQLKLFYEAGDYLFVHAGIRPGVPMEHQDPKDLLWIRGEFLQSRRNHGKIVVHGHASGSTVVERPNRICIDTAAYATDRLSCIVLEGRQRRYISEEL